MISRVNDVACSPPLRIEADYLIETIGDPRRAAETMAGEQSSGTFVPVPGETPELKARSAARVERLELLDGVFEVPSLPTTAKISGNIRRAVATLSRTNWTRPLKVLRRRRNPGPRPQIPTQIGKSGRFPRDGCRTRALFGRFGTSLACPSGMSDTQPAGNSAALDCACAAPCREVDRRLAKRGRSEA